MGFKIRLLVFFSTIFSLSIPELTAYAMPEQFKGKLDTFIKNPNLSYGSNIFINALPLVGAHAKEKLPLKKQSDLVAVGRQAYEELGNIFAQTKIALDIENLKLPGNHNKGINLRLYKGNKNDKVILYIHGGGWRQGSLDTHDALCREISHRTEYSLIAVDYRLSPENPFPAGLNDVEETYEWVLNHYSEAKVLLCGDSAGGNLATALAIKRLQEHKKGPDGLLLLYPALDLRVPEITDDPMADGYFLTRTRINDYVKAYLGKNFKKLTEDAIVSPLLATDDILKMLPPTLLIAAEYDPLTASSKEFVEKAKNAGANIDLKIVEKTIHIFAQYPELFEEANEALELLAQKAKDF
jgi:acetyl esterase